MIQEIEKWEQVMRKAKHRYGVDTAKCEACKEVWNDINLICVRDMCPKAMKGHLTIQAGMPDKPENQKAVIERWVQANVTDKGSAAMDVDALRWQTKEGGKGGESQGPKGGGKGSVPAIAA